MKIEGSWMPVSKALPADDSDGDIRIGHGCTSRPRIKNKKCLPRRQPGQAKKKNHQSYYSTKEALW